MAVNSLTPFLRVYLVVITFVLGLVMGSFCNAWAWRVVNGEKIQKGRSHCPRCGHTLAAKDLVPLFSWLFLKGRCRYCGEPISRRYPLAELISGLYYVSVVLTYGLTLDSLRFILTGSVVLIMSLVDMDIMELPDGFMIAAAAFSLLRLFNGTGAIKNMLLGLIPAFCLLLITLVMDRILKKESMGGGDIKLLAVFGLHLGAVPCVLLVIVACIVGLAVAKLLGKEKDTPFPFGPSLALAFWFTATVGMDLVNVYLSLF